jgi:alpha-beta hydrolase superfamily lysophospholipase
MEYVPLILLLLALAAAMCVVLLRVMAGHLLTPPRMTDGKAMYILKRLAPDDLGLPYEPCDFRITDSATGAKMKIAGWWIPAALPSARTVILLHGYSDAKVGGIAWAPVWRAIGFHVLAIDLRAHGESDGAYSTAGFYERDDLDQVIDQLRQLRPKQAEKVMLFGVSVGATVAAAVGARREDLMGVVLESPYADFRSAITAHGRRLAMPLEWGYGIAYRWAERISGARFDQIKPVELVKQIRSPLLVIHAGEDTFVSQDEMDQIAESLRSREASMITRHVLIEGVQHTRGLLEDAEAYRQMLASFVGQIDEQGERSAQE